MSDFNIFRRLKNAVRQYSKMITIKKNEKADEGLDKKRVVLTKLLFFFIISEFEYLLVVC